MWVGLDAHKKSINVAAIRDGETVLEVIVANQPKAVRRLAKKLVTLAEGGEVRCCYEAGPCGFVLKRQLEEAAPLVCEVIAPSLIPFKPGDKVKTDRRDARKLAQLLQADLLTEVQLPTEAEESARDLVRCREDMKQDQTRARHQLGKWLLRRGFRYTNGKKAWTNAHAAWMKSLTFEHDTDRLTFEAYADRLDSIQRQLDRVDAEILSLSQDDFYGEAVGRLRCFYGIDTITAMTIVTEIHGGVERFPTARQLMAYVGVVPSEHSSSDKTRRGAITKTGNAHLRRILIEAAWHFRHRPSVGKKLATRREGQPREVIAIADKAHARLYRRYRRLTESGKPSNKAVVAVARELTGFIWAALREEAA
jgi:transposase